MEKNLLFREIGFLQQQDMESSSPCKNQLCWIQESLNILKKSNLVINGKLDDATQSALEDYQTGKGLKITKKADPASERCLMEDRTLNQGFITKIKASFIIKAAKSKIEDWTAKAQVTDRKLVTNYYRNPHKVWALVLHHMAFKRRDKNKNYSNPESYLKTRAHFCILFDGRIIQLHPISRKIWHSNCTSGGSVGVEFEGNFPNINGKWWYPRDKETGKITARDEDFPTKNQVNSGQFLIQYLKAINGLTTILAHRQSSNNRTEDPGPDIWYNVGEWAIKNLGLTEGGASYKCGDGNPIHPKWRTRGDQHLV